MADLNIRRYREEDYEDFVRLWELQMGEDRALQRGSYFKWLIEGNPFSRAHDDYLVVEEDGRVIAYNGFMPFRFSIKGEDYDGNIYHDTLVDPAKRGQHLGSRLVKEMVRRNDRFAIAVWMNLPNARLYEKCGWQSVGKIYVHYRVYDAASFFANPDRWPLRWAVKVINGCLSGIYRLRRWGGRKVKGSLKIAEIDRFDERVDRLFDNRRRHSVFMACRTHDVLNWKYGHVENSRCTKLICTENDQLMGYIVFRLKSDPEKGRRKATIFDFLCAPDRRDVFSALLQAAVDRIETSRPDYIDILSTDRILNRMLRRHGFWMKKESPFALKTIHAEALASDADVSDANNWFFTYGDGDNLFWHFW
jgi:GNAT superfamily N-acetyltransferase